MYIALRPFRFIGILGFQMFGYEDRISEDALYTHQIYNVLILFFNNK